MGVAPSVRIAWRVSMEWVHRGLPRRVDAGIWVGSGWSRFPGGQGSMSTRMLQDDVMPDSKARPRRRISTKCCCDCENALLM